MRPGDRLQGPLARLFWQFTPGPNSGAVWSSHCRNRASMSAAGIRRFRENRSMIANKGPSVGTTILGGNGPSRRPTLSRQQGRDTQRMLPDSQVVAPNLPALRVAMRLHGFSRGGGHGLLPVKRAGRHSRCPRGLQVVEQSNHLAAGRSLHRGSISGVGSCTNQELSYQAYCRLASREYFFLVLRKRGLL